MSVLPPDRASCEVGTKFFFKDCGNIRISIDGVEQIANVREYCVSGGWARVFRRDASGNPIRSAVGGVGIKKVHGAIKVWWR